MIVDNRGRVIWYHQLAPPVQATDFRVQRYRGKPVLTFWEGTSSNVGVGRGSYLVYDTSYRQIARVRAAHGLQGDLHEFQLTPRGTAYITVYHEVASRPVDDRRPEARLCVRQRRRGDRHRDRPRRVRVAHRSITCRSPSRRRRTGSRRGTRRRSSRSTTSTSTRSPTGPAARSSISARNTSTIYLLARDGHIVWRLGGSRATSDRRRR